MSPTHGVASSTECQRPSWGIGAGTSNSDRASLVSWSSASDTGDSTFGAASRRFVQSRTGISGTSPQPSLRRIGGELLTPIVRTMLALKVVSPPAGCCGRAKSAGSPQRGPRQDTAPAVELGWSLAGEQVTYGDGRWPAGVPVRDGGGSARWARPGPGSRSCRGAGADCGGGRTARAGP